MVWPHFLSLWSGTLWSRLWSREMKLILVLALCSLLQMKNYSIITLCHDRVVEY
jgi:hypothetical protein